MNKFLVKKPIITEKSTDLGKSGKYVFLVDSGATVTEAKKVVQSVYNVTVVKANVINVKSKVRRLGSSVGVKPGYKKIIMTLKSGQRLDIIPQ
ncbi:MAG: 50S ribosomal protein L23 [Candidatus Harrisonbacteria bacterium RIFCSPLOWO2_02_FULL_45_10c]|uniref:Large ribosomal subunit protein uL23 n=1 Tax=Candidatus Harrisonbacteria bacterium RIFCSPLOWO2_02_FULL_45_10c TaxID=1798410 RepID=A0A1G1ZUF0_9BACT|nr:MAG: 50S ribosomal protein L23 [Candidatus Harrisonbacteria bacterium RIFCSPLOWO2_02_FULL_45_10c]